MFCLGDEDNCQYQCKGIEKYLSNCSNYSLRNNLRNGNNIHHCSVYVHSFSRLSYLTSSHPLQIKIEGSYLSSNIIRIKRKLLASLNGASKKELNNALLNSREICNNTKLKHFIVHEDRHLKDNTGPWTLLHYLIEEELKPKGYILYYQQPDLSKPEDSPEHYYQLTDSDKF
ncbi:17186_t:CDS:2 [Gigaspora rosea]|nr:17186_t:CDS:2 [Gigaspora rosea]